MSTYGGENGPLLAGRYRLVSRLGRGGMGTVWRAVDDLLGREVAVKELHQADEGLSGLDAQLRRERTLREARTLAQLKHPNVIVLHDVVEQDGRPWIVMELVDGQSLADRLAAQGPVGPREAARIVIALLDALRVAHACGVLHRDIKPANVLMEAGTGRVVLTDFGIAQVSGVTTITDTGSFVGSPEYTAPERMAGRRTGPESDLWSLGVLLCALVSGESPFHRDSLAGVLHAVAFDEIRPPAAAGPLLPVVQGLLERDWERRLDADATERLLRAYQSTGDTPEMPVHYTPTQYSVPDTPPQPVAPTPPQPFASAPPQPLVPGSPPQPFAPGPSSGASAPSHAASGSSHAASDPSSAAPRSDVADAAYGGTPPRFDLPSSPAPGAVPGPGAASAPAPGPAPGRAGKRPSRTRAALLSAVAVVVLVGAGAGIATLLMDRGDDASDLGGPGARTSGKSTHTSPASPSGGPTTKAKPTRRTKLPSGYTLKTDPLGFQVAVPNDFSRSVEGPRVYYYSPGREFRIGIHAQPKNPKGPLGTTRDADAEGPQNYPGYRAGQVIETEHHGVPAALWAFVWNGAADDGGDRQTFELSWDQGNQMHDVWVSAPVKQKSQGKRYFDIAVQTYSRPGWSN
ncbi:serine/threonine-protein kinase [Streptomyces sp. XD-27]|uniref:serine/threonine-protein kinase n=1 Tax=Streptomyces sp. XD-27 TaxID=3062779 RepID=UPI0026F43824|nr:serine/threonine-protein kinase [Streptomyces sp. XD-27]WKX70927.1 serine/threonine-protein kinase [Streptomyces sp. XD-27]